jgi:hypothetical protein
MTTPAPTPTPTPMAIVVDEPCESFEVEAALVVDVGVIDEVVGEVIDVPVLVVAVDVPLDDSVVVVAVEVGCIPAVAVMVGSSRMNFKYEALVQQSSAEQQ